MATTTSSGITATIPDLSDVANVQTAFTDYHASVADDIASKAEADDSTLTGTTTAEDLTVSGTITGDVTGDLTGNVNGKVTINQSGTSIGKIFVQSTQPTGASAGDIWMW